MTPNITRRDISLSNRVGKLAKNRPSGIGLNMSLMISMTYSKGISNNTYNYLEDKGVIDSCLEYCQEMYATTVGLSEYFYTDFLIPLGEGLLLIYSVTEMRIYFYCLNFDYSWILEKISTLLQNTKLLLTKQWLRLDYDCDGKVSLDDIISTVSFLYNSVSTFYEQNLQKSPLSKMLVQGAPKIRRKKF
ncbi:unnamed protein product [Moneuplotes crassus]|uniref:EF-hand domain-containing protein n=1 Tax=Euplotes crassus TaxID=5936 RepID=A0AAD1XZG3_EUPCR|nr:unnamed protein product [Moneuplotes crassus]